MQGGKAAGVIDLLAESFHILNRRPWLLLIPAVLDFLIWLGPRITVEAFARRLMARNADYEGLMEVLGDVNLLGLLGWRFSSAVGPAAGGGPALDVGSAFGVAVVTVACLVAGLAMFSLFYVLVVDAAAGRKVGVAMMMPRARIGFLRLLGLWGALGAAILAVGAGILTLTLAGPAGQALAGILLLTAGAAALILWVLLYFVQPAIYLDEMGVRQAVRRSVQTVRREPGATIRLFAMVLLIAFGTGLAWQGVAKTALGTGIAIIGNAYVMSGLALAVPLFYINRRPARPVGESSAPAGRSEL